MQLWRTLTMVISFSPRATRGFTPFMDTRTDISVHSTEDMENTSMSSSRKKKL